MHFISIGGKVHYNARRLDDVIYIEDYGTGGRTVGEAPASVIDELAAEGFDIERCQILCRGIESSWRGIRVAQGRFDSFIELPAGKALLQSVKAAPSDSLSTRVANGTRLDQTNPADDQIRHAISFGDLVPGD